MEDGQKLIPSVTRVFTKSREMYVYLQAYERASTALSRWWPLWPFTGVQAKVFETPPLPSPMG